MQSLISFLLTRCNLKSVALEGQTHIAYFPSVQVKCKLTCNPTLPSKYRYERTDRGKLLRKTLWMNDFSDALVSGHFYVWNCNKPETKVLTSNHREENKAERPFSGYLVERKLKSPSFFLWWLRPAFWLVVKAVTNDVIILFSHWSKGTAWAVISGRPSAESAFYRHKSANIFSIPTWIPILSMPS